MRFIARFIYLSVRNISLLFQKFYLSLLLRVFVFAIMYLTRFAATRSALIPRAETLLFWLF